MPVDLITTTSAANGTSSSPPAPTDLHVVFYDSSDDDNSHEADVSILSAPASSISSEEPSPGWLEMIGGAVRNGTAKVVHTARRYTQPRRHAANEPFDAEDSHSLSSSAVTFTSSSSDDGAPTLAYGTSQFRDRGEAMLEEAVCPLDEETGEMGVDLEETIRQFQRTPDDFYRNIILAALKSGVVVNGRLLAAAMGSAAMIEILMESDHLDEDDDELQVIVQQEIDRLLRGDPYKGEYIPAAYAAYLHTLCKVGSARLNLRQMVLIRYSGFAFIQTIIDYPHLLQDAVTLRSCQIRLFRSGYIFNVIILRLCWIPTLLLNPCIFLTCTFWFLNGYLYYGYWTVLCYFVGFMAWVMTTIKAEQRKIKVYPDSGRWAYPDNYYVMFPIIPLYKIILGVQGLRHDLSSNNSRYVVIRHDLSNGFGVQQVAEGTFSALPQMVLQVYFFASTSHRTTLMRACIYSFVSISILSVFFAMCCFARYATYAHSCDLFGFAILTVEEWYLKRRIANIPILPSNVVTRFVQFFCTALTVAVFVTLLTEIGDVHRCPVGAVVVVMSCMGLALLTAIVQIMIISIFHFSRLNALVALPLLLSFTAYLVYYALETADDGNCSILVKKFLPYSHFPAVAVYGCTTILFFVWLIITFIERVLGRRLIQRSIDYCFWQTCKKPKKQIQPDPSSFLYSDERSLVSSRAVEVD